MYYLKPQHTADRCFVLTGKNSSYTTHIHENLELIYIKTGSREVIIHQQAYLLKAGDLAVIYPFVPHGFRAVEQGECAWVGIHPLFLNPNGFSLFGQAPTCPVIAKNSQPAQLKLLLQALFLKNCHAALFIKGVVAAALSLCEPLLKINCAQEYGGQTNPAEVLQYIIAHAANGQLTAENTAQNFGMAERYFCAWLGRVFGMGFHRLLSCCRLNNAALMLTGSNTSVTQIGYKCGFESIRTFNRLFLAEYGCSPQQYRKNGQKQC